MIKDSEHIARLKATRREERYRANSIWRKLADLRKEAACYGLMVEFTVENQPYVRRKKGYSLVHFQGRYAICPSCFNRLRIYYRYTEVQPWHKVTDYQCGRCGHEWQHIDNTYD